MGKALAMPCCWVFWQAFTGCWAACLLAYRASVLSHVCEGGGRNFRFSKIEKEKVAEMLHSGVWQADFAKKVVTVCNKLASICSISASSPKVFGILANKLTWCDNGFQSEAADAISGCLASCPTIIDRQLERASVCCCLSACSS